MVEFLRALLGDAVLLSWLEEPLWRACCALVTAFTVALVTGPPLIRWLRKRQIVDQIEKGDSAQLDRMSISKQSTPTLGGLIFLSALIVSTALWARLDEPLLLVLVGYVVGLSLLGFVDDWTKLKSGRKGVKARHKLTAQLLLSLAAGYFLYAFPPQVTIVGSSDDGGGSLALFLPFFKDQSIPLGVLFIPMVVLVTTGASNAVNLTDGLDGLAIGCSTLVAATLAVVAFFVAGEPTAEYLRLPHVAGAAEVGVFAAALVGGGLGFLWFNCHPAEIFMGDTGALPLGGALGLMAVLCKQELLLVLLGGVLVAEALSVMIQVGVYKVWRRRVFRIAPLHHHFQFKGLAESRITVRFWMVGAVLALCSVMSVTIG